MTNYAAMVKRIKACKTVEEIRKCEKSLDRLYNAGIFSSNELIRLDALIINQMEQVEYS